MKSLIQAVVVAAVLAAPAAAFAQSNQPATRAQVRAELVQLEKTGYNPAASEANYPVGIQAAEARVAAQNGATTDSVGGVASGSSASGARVTAGTAANAGMQSIYFGQ
jgi:hypothetical protein